MFESLFSKKSIYVCKSRIVKYCVKARAETGHLQIIWSKHRWNDRICYEHVERKIWIKVGLEKKSQVVNNGEVKETASGVRCRMQRSD